MTSISKDTNKLISNSTAKDSSAKKAEAKSDTKTTKVVKPEVNKMSAKEEMALLEAAIVDIRKPIKDDPELANMDAPTYSPQELKAKALTFLSGPKATPAERAALQEVLKKEVKE